MQKITYVNCCGESVVFSGAPPVLLRSVSGFSRPEETIVRAQGAYQAGATLLRQQCAPRSVQVHFDILPCESREALYAQRMRIERALCGSRCLKDGVSGVLTYENDAGVWQTDAVPEGPIAYGKRFLNGMAGSRVNFLCGDAYLRAGLVQHGQMRMGQGSLILPAALPLRLGARDFKATLQNGGTADTPMTVTIYGTGETPTLVNHTTGAKLIVSRAIPEGDRLVIDTAPQRLSCLLHHADGSVEDAFGALDPSVAVSAFVLVPGENEMEYVPSAASTGSRVEIAWQARYEGV